MENKNNYTRSVKDFKNGWRVFYKTILSMLIPFVILAVVTDNAQSSKITSDIIFISFLAIEILLFLLSFVGFYINYTPLEIKNGKVFIPASDQIRTFLDLLTLNPITGYYRKRVYNVENIENVANGYTRPGRGTKGRTWDVIITGMHNNKSFSQRIDVSDKQVRDEVRNALKHTISGKINSEMSY